MIVKLENEKEINIERLPLGKYADLLQAFQELPKNLKEFQNFDQIDNQQMIEVLPSLIGKCFPDFLRIIPIATPLSEEEVQSLSLTEMMDVVTAIIQVNNFQGAFERIKKLLAQRNLIKSSQPQSSNIMQ